MTTADPKRLNFLAKIADIRNRLSLKFDSENPGFKRGGKASKYLSQGGLMADLNPLLEEHNLIVTQAPDVTPGGFVLVTVIQDIDPERDEDGVLYDSVNHIACTWPINKELPAQKKVAESTYAARVSIVRLLALVADEDDDGNLSSGVSATTSTQGLENLLGKI